MTIFSGTVAGNITPENFIDDLNDVTGVGFGNFTDRISGERYGSIKALPHQTHIIALPHLQADHTAKQE